MNQINRFTINEMNNMKEKLLMLGTSYGSCEMIRYAKSQGVYTIVTDPQPYEKSKAKQIADEYWMYNTTDIDTLEKKCREENVTAVICGISELNLEMVMELCSRLGLTSYCTPEAWHFSHDKADFKKLCAAIGVPIPEDYPVSADLTDEEIDKVKFPVMVKPVDLNANRGISYCYNKEDLKKAYKLALSMSQSPKIIVERMLHGEEWWAGYALAEGKISLISLNAMYAEPGYPKNCYTITTTISNHIEQFISKLNPKIEELLEKVGCREGYAWVQLMRDEDGEFYVIEMGYRLTGEQIFMQFPYLCGYDTIKQLVDISRGIKFSADQLPSPQQHAYKKSITAYSLWAKKNAVISKMEGIDKMAEIPGVFVETLAETGDEVGQYRQMGYIVFGSETIQDACKMIQLINDTVHVYDEDGEDLSIKYTDFDYLTKMYNEGLNGIGVNPL